MSTTGTSTTTASNLTAPTQFLETNGEKYAYRRRCAWKAIRQYFEVCSLQGTLPAGILSIATAGDFLNWNPHIHALVASGTFHADGSFVPAALLAENVLRELFEAHVYKLLVSKELIGPDLIAKMRTWKHSGFHVYVGPSIMQKEDAACWTLYCARSGFGIQTSAYKERSAEIPCQRITAKRPMRFSV